MQQDPAVKVQVSTRFKSFLKEMKGDVRQKVRQSNFLLFLPELRTGHLKCMFGYHAYYAVKELQYLFQAKPLI